MNIKRGDIFYINAHDGYRACGSESWSNRPGLIISNNIGNKHSSCVTVAYITHGERATLPTHYSHTINGESGIVMCEQIFTVDKSRLGEKIAYLNHKTMIKIDEHINIALGIQNKSTKAVFTKWVHTINRYGYNKIDNDIDNNKAIIENLKKERDGYKLLYESTQN